MLERLWKAAIPIAWVVADTVYGGNLDLRNWLEAHAYPYVLAVACDEPVGIQTPLGRRRVEVREVEALLLQDEDWQRLSMSDGTKGLRLFDWARLPMLHQWEDDGQLLKVNYLSHQMAITLAEKGFLGTFQKN